MAPTARRHLDRSRRPRWPSPLTRRGPSERSRTTTMSLAGGSAPLRAHAGAGGRRLLATTANNLSRLSTLADHRSSRSAKARPPAATRLPSSGSSMSRSTTATISAASPRSRRIASTPSRSSRPMFVLGSTTGRPEARYSGSFDGKRKSLNGPGPPGWIRMSAAARRSGIDARGTQPRSRSPEPREGNVAATPEPQPVLTRTTRRPFRRSAATAA